MSNTAEQQFDDAIAKLVKDHDTHYPDKKYFEQVFVYGSDYRWTVKQFDPEQALALLHCKSTNVEKWFRWESISYIEPF